MAEKMKAKDDEIAELKTELEDIKAECGFYLKQYRVFGRENRDQKKEIESLKTKLKSVNAENSSLKQKVSESTGTFDPIVGSIEHQNTARPGQGQSLGQLLHEDDEEVSKGLLKHVDNDVFIVNDEQNQPKERNSAQMGRRIDNSEMLTVTRPADMLTVTRPAEMLTVTRPADITQAPLRSTDHDDKVAMVQPRRRTKPSGKPISPTAVAGALDSRVLEPQGASVVRRRPKEKKRSKMSLVLQKPSPWRCTSCSGYFTTIDYLRDHIKIYHPNRKYFCQRCSFSSKSKKDIEEHLQERVHA